MHRDAGEHLAVDQQVVDPHGGVALEGVGAHPDAEFGLETVEFGGDGVDEVGVDDVGDDGVALCGDFGGVAVGGGVGFTVAMFVASGPWIWVWSAVGAIVGAAAVPALGVYGPELFPTASRGSANGGINVAAVTGAVVGLLTAGYLSDLFGGLPAAIAILAVGPAIVVLLVVFAYPETAHRELEDINPTDHRPIG